MVLIQSSLSYGSLTGRQEWCRKWERWEEKQDDRAHDDGWDSLYLNKTVSVWTQTKRETYEKEKLPSTNF